MKYKISIIICDDSRPDPPDLLHGQNLLKIGRDSINRVKNSLTTINVKFGDTVINFAGAAIDGNAITNARLSSYAGMIANDSLKRAGVLPKP